MNRFEQLIEYVINDEEAKARELFHDIVVEKSRQIYENIMAEEADEELDENLYVTGTDDEEEDPESLDENLYVTGPDGEIEEGMGGDAADDLIDDVEMEEESDMNMEADGDNEDYGNEPATKDDILNLEDKLDQLMAEFEAAMGGDDMGNGDGFGPEEGGDAIEMDDTGEMEPGMMEAISLKAAPKPVTTEQGDGKAGPVAFNSGATGMASKPVKTGTDGGGKHDAAGAYSNQVKDQPGYQGNGHYGKPGPAPKPKMGANSEGQNNKSPLPSGRKG